MRPVTMWLGLAFIGYAVASVAWSPGGGTSALILLTLLCGGFIAGVLLPDMRMVWYGYCYTAMVVLALAMTYVEVGANALGAVLAVALAASIAFEFWILVPVFCFGLWWCQSRTALIAGGVVCLIGLWRRAPATAYSLGALALVFAMAQRPELTTMGQRVGIWYDTIQHLSFWGSGFGSFAAAYASWPVHTNMTGVLAPHAYNDALELLFELGIGSALGWAFLIFCFEGRCREDRLICLTFGVLSLAYFPLWVVGPMFAMALGHLSKTGVENGSMEINRIALPQN